MTAERPIDLNRPAILCVDDDTDLLEGLALTLHQNCQVYSAAGGAEGLQVLERHPEIVTVVSDIRMPGMDGAQFLAEVRKCAPDCTRILLTGYSDIDSAIRAINQGEIFRFLTKPCSADVLRTAIAAGIEHNRLITAEHVLLRETVQGCVEALVEALTLAEPLIFGMASRVKYLASQVAALRKHPLQHVIETAALLANLGMIGKSPEQVAELVHADASSDADLFKLTSVADQTNKLLAHIPRIEDVRLLILLADDPSRQVVHGFTPEGYVSALQAADILRVCQQFCLLEQRGLTSEAAVQALRQRGGARLPADVLTHLEQVVGLEHRNLEMRSLPLRALVQGMVLCEPLKTVTGQLLAPAGYAVTASFAQRAAGIRHGTVKEPIRVLLRRPI